VGPRDAINSFTGIEVCLQVSPNIADRAMIEMAAKTAQKARKASFSAAGRVMASEEGDLRAEWMQDANVGFRVGGHARLLWPPIVVDKSISARILLARGSTFGGLVVIWRSRTRLFFYGFKPYTNLLAYNLGS
jgi:hypothetical protein